MKEGEKKESKGRELEGMKDDENGGEGRRGGGKDEEWRDEET